MSDTAHPLLPAATPVLQAGGSSIQIGGVDSTDGVLVTPAPGTAAVLRGLDGRRAQRDVLADAVRDGLDADLVRSLLDGLRNARLLFDVDSADLLTSAAGPAARARTATELPAVLVSGPGASWRARRTSVVEVDGATRVGAPLAALLAAGGVGRVSIRDPELTTAADAIVGGLTAADEGRPRSIAAADAVRRASPLTDLRPLPPGTPADLVVLARAWAAADPLVAGLQRAGVPHLVATVRGETGIVGPLVVPGRTGCLRCADLHRRDADPRWPRLAAQLTASPPPPSGATLTCLTTAVTAARQVLAYLDGSGAPATLDGTIELRPPDLVPRIRRWLPHPDCGCLPTGDVPAEGLLGRLPGDGAPPSLGEVPAGRATMDR